MAGHDDAPVPTARASRADDSRPTAPTRRSERRDTDLSRRDLLRTGGSVALLAGVAGCGSSNGDGDGAPTEDAPPTETDRPAPGDVTTEEEHRRLAERFAPDLLFDVRERWFPTDPRQYASTRDGDVVVSGFDALDGYTARDERVPDPTVFYRVVDYSERLAVVQFWFYSVFDQFTTNFHWHDWELLQTFVDRERDEAVLHVASAHAAQIPNNEFVDPGDARPAILSEVGSHSSALGLNEDRESFQRISTDALGADITNRALGTDWTLPFAYGLPRDEGLALPFVVPELDGAPIYEHERLPNVTADDLLPADLTVRSFDSLSSPPGDLPRRETGLVLSPDDAGDVRYDLVPTGEVEHITAFTGPRLSFEFAIPSFAEDLVAQHLSTPGVPWTQERYSDPVADVTDPSHRATLAERFEAVEPGGVASTLVASLREMQEAIDIVGSGLSLVESSVEGSVLLESDPVAVPTWRGQVGLRDVPDGDHRLTVNAPGLAPYTERVTVDGATRAGRDGRLPLVANADAVKVEADGRENGGLGSVRVADDNAGVLFDAPPHQSDRFGVYVHRRGAYVVEVRDRAGSVGAERVRPADDRTSVRVSTATGKAPLSSFLSTYVSDLRDDAIRGLDREVAGSGASDDGDAEGDETTTATEDGSAAPADRVLNRLGAAAEAFSRAASVAEDRRADRANERLEAARDRVREAGAAAASGDLPPGVENLLERRLPVAERYIGLALDEPN